MTVQGVALIAKRSDSLQSNHWPAVPKARSILIRRVPIFIELMIAILVKPPDATGPHSTRENAMMRALVLSALLVGGASLAVAQNGPATGGQAPAAAGNPAAAVGASIPARTARHHGTRHHRMYMMSVNRTHKGSKLTPASNANPQMKK